MEATARVSAGAGQRSSRPVVLATLGVPFDPVAAAVAVDAAVEAGEPLVFVNAVVLPPLTMSVQMGYDQLPEEPVDAEAFGAPARLAASLGVAVERLRVRSPRPLEALLEVVAERRPGLLVFGPDRGRMRRRTYRKAVRALQERTGCLLWLAN